MFYAFKCEEKEMNSEVEDRKYHSLARFSSFEFLEREKLLWKGKASSQLREHLKSVSFMDSMKEYLLCITRQCQWQKERQKRD